MSWARTDEPTATPVREHRWSPEEGWSVLFLVILLGQVVAIAMDEPAWVDGRGNLTDCLGEMALLGTLAGFLGAKLGWGRWTTHLVGALFAGLLIPIIAGTAVMPGLSPAQAFRFTADGTVEAYLDLTVRNLQFTTQEVHYVLVLGGLVWGTMQFGAYAVFGHRRPLSAVILVGLVLLANMSLTTRDQLGWLVLYAVLALFLLIQMHTFGERMTWMRRRIGDPGSISMVYLRGGTVFIGIAMAAALILQQNATSSPLAGAWIGLRGQLIAFGEQVGRLFPTGGDIRGGGGVTFGNSARISAQWFSDNAVAFTADVPPSAAGLKWRAATYDQFVLGGWVQSETHGTSLVAGVNLLDGSPEIPDPKLYSQLQVKVQSEGFHGGELLSPGLPAAVNQPSTLALTGIQGWFADDEIARDSSYTVNALVPRLTDETGITANKLRAAATVYPPDVTAEYTQIPAGAIGPYAQQLLDTILSKVKGRNPYDIANEMQTYLTSTAFSYTTDVRGLDCQSAVECFAQYRRGYCLHYASAMAILLRAAIPDNPIPTRLVQGFLPSPIVNGRETVQDLQAHAWVEVFFPGYGWIPFDPTGGPLGQRPVGIATHLPEGAVVPPAPPPSIPADTGGDFPHPTRRAGPVNDVPATGTQGGSVQPADRTVAAIIGVLLVLGLGALILAAWWRGPRGEVSPDAAWTAVSAAASRFGFAPRPTETVYEYASSLGELVPVARPDISTVAVAKVETTYARTTLTPEREAAVAAAMRRLRLTLVRLLFRRLRRPRRRR